MDEQAYIRERVNIPIDWYQRYSISQGRLYHIFRTTEILLAAAIPVLTAYATDVQLVRFVSNAAAVLIVFFSGLSRLWKFQDNWMRYRMACESLKHEKYLYLAKAGVYSKPDAFPVFVQHIETLHSKETTQWVYVNTDNDGKIQNSQNIPGENLSKKSIPQ